MLRAVVDFETTGLLKREQRFDKQPSIWEIGCVVIDDDYNEVRVYHQLVNPDIDPEKWDREALDMAHKKPEDLINEPTFFLAFHDFADTMLGVSEWVGFNCEFDKSILWWQLQRSGFEQSFPWPPRTLDVMKRAGRRLDMQGKRGAKNPKLSEAYEALVGKPMEDAHMAVADCRATVEVLRRL